MMQQWNPMMQPTIGWVPPTPPATLNKGQGYPYPHPYSYNPPGPAMCYGHPMQKGRPDNMQQRMMEFQGKAQGKGQGKAMEDTEEEWASTDSTEETEHMEPNRRRSSKRPNTKKGGRKRKVVLTIKGQKVPAYYRSP